jgi:DNA-binding response OmpR family regulator
MNDAILIVDDDEACLSLLSEYFTKQGFQVTSAQELEEAEALILRFAYSLVIADLSLTMISSDEGLRLIDHIRERSARTKIILLSGRMSSEVHTEALRRGAQAALTKPQSLSNLGTLADKILEGPDGPTVCAS